MQTLVHDYESYLDSEVTLKTMPTIQYVRHPKFKVHGAAIKEDDRPAFWVTGKDLPKYYAGVQWEEIDSISHHALFDCLVTYEHYGHTPKRRIDTLGLARALLPADLDFDLDSLGTVLGIGGKHGGGKIIQRIKGIVDLPADLELELAEYAIVDAERAYQFYQLLWPHLPEIERRLLDLTIRMGTQGVLRFNHTTAQEAKRESEERRTKIILASGLSETTLRSADKLAEEFRKRGVEPPTKVSEKKSKTAGTEIRTYAFSKSDRAFLDLLDHPDVAHIANGRLAAMSSGDVKRIDRLLAITGLAPFNIPMPLNYCGAHTYRWSGTGKINVQNLKKENGKAGKLRKSFEAPDGYVINVADSAQIELRMNMWYCKQLDILDILSRPDGDVYSHTATSLFNRPINKAMVQERQFGKVVELGCGYQMGWPKFKATCAIGPMGNPPIFISNEEAQNAINTYRATHPMVVAKWDWLARVAIPTMAQKDCHLQDGPITFKFERIELPNGLALQYPNLRFHVNEETGESGWVYGLNGVVHKIYGGKLLENIIQALARIVVAEQLDRIDREVEHAVCASMTHDENIAVSPDPHAENVQRQMIAIMSTAPAWAPDLPVKAEGGYAKEYSK